MSVKMPAIFLRRSLLLGAAGMLSSASATTPPRLRPMVPPDLDDAQQRLYDTLVDTRIRIVGKAALFDERGALRGPWNAEVASPALGKHLERLATAVRSENSLEPRLYEVAVLVVGVHWQAQFEWYAHERLARQAGVAEAALLLIKAGAPAFALRGLLLPDELAVYRLAHELMATRRVSADTFAEAKQALGGDDRKMVDLCMTMGCYSAVSLLLNMFEVALPPGETPPFPEAE